MSDPPAIAGGTDYVQQKLPTFEAKPADVNACATIDELGVGGQTAIFHAATQYDDVGLAVTRLLVERGADLAVRVKLPGDYEQRGETVECTVLGCALRFGGSNQRRTVTLLRDHGAVE